MTPARTPIHITCFGAEDPDTTIVFSTGFIGLVGMAAGLDPTGQTIQRGSMFGNLILEPGVRLVLVEHPARRISPQDLMASS